MDPHLCRNLNLMSLEQLALYLDEDYGRIESLYYELLSDTLFLEQMNAEIARVKPSFQKGICRQDPLDSVDWFAIQRIILYILIRLYKPKHCLETGVFYGGNTSFILNALHKNQTGALLSIDLPSQKMDPASRHHLVGDAEDLPDDLDTGFLIPAYLKARWTLIRGDSLQEIPRLPMTFDLYMHDSEHSYHFLKTEMSLVSGKLHPKALVIVDDLDWSNGFFGFCDVRCLYPLIITDNGKSGLRARTGIIKMHHPFHDFEDVTGRSAMGSGKIAEENEFT